MDAWGKLLQHLQNPLCQDDDLSNALSKVLDEGHEAPQDCRALIRKHLGTVMATATDVRIQEFGEEVAQRIGPLGDALARGGQRRGKQQRLLAQDVDRMHGNCEWSWIMGPGDFGDNATHVPPEQLAPNTFPAGKAPGTASSISSSEQELEPPRLRLETAAPLPSTASRGGQALVLQTCLLQEFAPLPVAKRLRVQTEGDHCQLEVFAPLKQAMPERRQAMRRVHRGRGGGGALDQQAQSILVSLHDRVNRWPEELRKTVRPYIEPNGRTQGMTFPSKVVSWLTGLSTRTVDNTVSHVAKNGLGKRVGPKRKRVAEPQAQGEVMGKAMGGSLSPDQGGATGECLSPPAAPPPAHGPGFKNLVRLCAVISSHGWPKSSLPPLAHALIEARGDVGESYILRQFMTAFDATVCHVALYNIQRFLTRPMGGTGLPPVVELIADGVTAGKYFGRASASVMVCGALLSVPDPPYVAEIFFGGQSQGADERAPAIMERLEKICRHATGADFGKFLREQVGTTCGDGAMCRGGVKAKHKSGASMNLVWTDLARTAEDDGTWDAFHTFSQAGSEALMGSAMGQLYCKVLKYQEHLFALGQGKELRSSLAEYLHRPDRRILAVCGHRKIGYISAGFCRWLANFRLDFDAYNLRMIRALHKRGSSSFEVLKERAEDFANPCLVVFVLAMHAGMQDVVQPINLRCQDSADIPWERWSAVAECIDTSNQIADQIKAARVFVRVVFLLGPYLRNDPVVLRRYWYCVCSSPRCRLLHSKGRWHALAHLFPIFYDGQFQETVVLANSTHPPTSGLRSKFPRPPRRTSSTSQRRQKQ